MTFNTKQGLWAVVSKQRQLLPNDVNFDYFFLYINIKVEELMFL